MQRSQLIQLIDGSFPAASVTTDELKQCLQQFPYCQSLQLLYARQLHDEQHFAFSEQLKTASIYAGDRKKLYELINNSTSAENNGHKVKADAHVAKPQIKEELKTDYNIPTEIIPPIETEAGDIESENVEDLSLSENKTDLNDLIERRIQELTSTNWDKEIEESNQEHEQAEINKTDKEQEVVSQEEATVLNIYETDIAGETEINDVDEIKNAEENSEIRKDETGEQVSLSEEIAAINTCEETAIADDVFKEESRPVVVQSAKREEEIDKKENTDKLSAHTFLDWLKMYRKSGNESEGEGEGEGESNEYRHPSPALVPQNDLIEKFIETEPRIIPKKNAFYSPSVAARKSVIYDDEVISETLAEIFFNQQLYEKAIRAYEILSLKFPEKSTLFAARIEKIKEEGKSGKA